MYSHLCTKGTLKPIITLPLVAGINNSCLVFDGRLVIDTECHTNDPVIYAAGPLTKYKRAFYCDEFTHDIYCSKEIGVHWDRTFRLAGLSLMGIHKNILFLDESEFYSCTRMWFSIFPRNPYWNVWKVHTGRANMNSGHGLHGNIGQAAHDAYL